MNKFKTHIIAIILVALAIAGSAFYLFSQDKSQAPTEQEPTVQQEEQPLSEEELTALWANGERCFREYFFAGFGQISVTPEYGEPYLNFVKVYFTDDATCEDVERVAILLDAKIAAGDIEDHLYGFQLHTETLEDLEEAIMKVENIKDLKIKTVDKVRRIDPRGFEEF